MCSFKSFINLQRKQAHMIAYGCTSKNIILSFFLRRKRYDPKKKKFDHISNVFDEQKIDNIGATRNTPKA